MIVSCVTLLINTLYRLVAEAGKKKGKKDKSDKSSKFGLFGHHHNEKAQADSAEQARTTPTNNDTEAKA